MLDLIIPVAHAADAVAEVNPILQFLPLILLFAVFYFVLIRPQQKRAKEQKIMIAGIKVGDEVVTNGGVLGRVVEVEESFLQVQIASDLTVTLQRHAISALMPKGTFNAAKSTLPQDRAGARSGRGGRSHLSNNRRSTDRSSQRSSYRSENRGEDSNRASSKDTGDEKVTKSTDKSEANFKQGIRRGSDNDNKK